MARDYETSPEADGLGLQSVILGLVSDIEALRAGTISPQDALARAALAKQVFNGVRLHVAASQFIARTARDVSAIAADPVQE